MDPWMELRITSFKKYRRLITNFSVHVWNQYVDRFLSSPKWELYLQIHEWNFYLLAFLITNLHIYLKSVNICAHHVLQIVNHLQT